ncbi:hypothetical protein LPJ64_005407 [Coemansia asiatica]|uniref:Uncharacterized protein n=1 Tax=Coemansia asiatica TaxID=1052880 RepID=A0A9W8CI69_9FUNG|nr:hypothetical protein LPJ64_005407 [Coemansia asiatica]
MISLAIYSRCVPRVTCMKGLRLPSVPIACMSTTRSTKKPKPAKRKQRQKGTSKQSFSAKDESSGKLQDVERSLWRKQLVLDHFFIPGKYQKYFTGRLRKRERSRMEKQLQPAIDSDSTDLKRLSARSVTMDESVQAKKMEMMRSQILRILERYLASGNLPVRQLSLQYWEITDVLVSFNLKTAVCCYKVTANSVEDDVQPFQVRKIIRESTEYLNLVVNQELSKGASRGIGAPRAVRLKFTNSTSTTKLMEMMQAGVDAKAAFEQPTEQRGHDEDDAHAKKD